MNANKRSLLHSVIQSRTELTFEGYEEMRETCIYEKLMAVQAALLLPNVPKEFSIGTNNLVSDRFWEKRSWPLNCRPDDLYEYYLFGGGDDYPSFKDALASDSLFTIHFREFEGTSFERTLLEDIEERDEENGECSVGLEELIKAFCEEFGCITESEARGLFYESTEPSFYSPVMVRTAMSYWLRGAYSRFILTTLESREIYKFLKRTQQQGIRNREEKLAEILIGHIAPFSKGSRFLSFRTLREESKEFVLHVLCGYSDYFGGGGCGLCNVSPQFLFERALLKELLLNP